jgi:hypothetical protein
MSAANIVTERLPGSGQPGYINTVSFRGARYKIFAYVEEADGRKRYLPDHCDPQTMEKVRTLVNGLFNAHDSRLHGANEASCEIQGMDARGLLRRDNTVVSHDFNIQPYSQQIAEQMTNTLSLYGRNVQPATIKALDLWNTLDDAIRSGVNAPAPSPQATPPPPPPSNNAIPNPAPPNAPNTPPPPSAPPTSIDLDLGNVDLQQPNWYEQIPLRTKLRIVRDVASGTSPLGGVYAQVWNHFATGRDALSALKSEEKRLTRASQEQLPSAIPPQTRQKAEHIYEAFKRRREALYLRQKAEELMSSDFPRKETLYRRIREQALAEGKRIEEWDQQWAEYHYAEDPRLFVQALARWLDNDTNQ